MAKKKSLDESDKPEKKDKSLSLEAHIQKEFGDNILVDANYVFNHKGVVIPISPSLDTITGGMPEGGFFTLTGQPKCGKTTTSLDFASTAQNPKYGGECCPDGRHVYFYAAEGRLKERDIAGIPHLVRDRFHIIQSAPGKILNAADYLEIAEKFISEKPGSVHIIDSYSALCTDLETTGSMSDQQRADGPKVIAKFCRKVCNKVPVNRCIVIGITHQMGNPTGYSEFKEKSGQSIAYQVDVKLKCNAFRKWTLSEDGAAIGQETDWTCPNTATYVQPWGKCTSYIRYGKGIDKTKEALNLAVDLGIVLKGGAWYTFPMFNDRKAQGIENCVQIIEDIPGGYDKLYEAVKDMMGLTI
jgi:recombination protein RecA